LICPDTFVNTLEDSILFFDTEDILRLSTTLKDFIGITIEEARVLAESMDRPARTTQEDGECFAVTLDFVPQRLNFAVEEGVIVYVRTDSGNRAGILPECDNLF